VAKNVAKFIIDIDEKGKPIIKSTGEDFERLEGKAKKTGATFRTLRSHWLALTAAMAAGVYAITKASKSFIEAAAYTEGLSTRLRALLGSVEEGNKLFKLLADYAGKVPFEYREVMAAATQLAGIMRGGSDQIMKWMPLIGDLAAAAGLGIQQTTEQVMRMLSAGAASADMFRERGILAMLGFTAGVKYSAEETKQILWEAWTGVGSKFKGLTQELAKNWDGLTSMMSDAWFKLKESLGVILLPALKIIVMWITNIINRMKDWVATNRVATQSIMKEGLLKIVDGLKATSTGVQLVMHSWYGWRQMVDIVTSVILKAFSEIVKGATWLLEKLNFRGVFDTWLKALDDLQTSTLTWSKIYMKDAENLITKQNAIVNSFETIRRGIESLGIEVEKQWPKLTEMMITGPGVVPPPKPTIPGEDPELEMYMRRINAMEEMRKYQEDFEKWQAELQKQKMTSWDLEMERIGEMIEQYGLLGTAVREFINVKNLENIMVQTVGSSIQAAILGYENVGKSLKKALAETLAAITAESAVRSLFNTALGFSYLALHMYSEASKAFTAAKVFAMTAAMAGAAAAVARAAAGGPESAEQRGYAEARGAGVAGLAREGEPGEYAQRYEVHIHGDVIGTEEWVENVLVPELKKVAKRDTQIDIYY